MSKFGDLISGNVPVLLHFYVEENTTCQRMHQVVKEVANHFGNKARVVEINVNANREIVRALQVASLPDFMIYKNAEMLWRGQGGQTFGSLKSALENFTA